MTDLRTAAQQALAFTMRDFASLRDFEAAKAVLYDILRAVLAQQAEPVEPAAKVELMMTGGNAGLATRIVEIDHHLRERLRLGQLLYTASPQQAEPVLQTCNCRWDGEVQVQQCTLHEAHVDAIHEWAERAKTAEKKLAALAQQAEPVAVTHKHEWFSTGGMEPGQSRCIHCGVWAKE